MSGLCYPSDPRLGSVFVQKSSPGLFTSVLLSLALHSCTEFFVSNMNCILLPFSTATLSLCYGLRSWLLNLDTSPLCSPPASLGLGFPQQPCLVLHWPQRLHFSSPVPLLEPRRTSMFCTTDLFLPFTTPPPHNPHRQLSLCLQHSAQLWGPPALFAHYAHLSGVMLRAWCWDTPLLHFHLCTPA